MLDGMLAKHYGPPDVDFLVFTHPAQSVSTYTSILLTLWRRYVYTSLDLPHRYLPSLLKASRLCSVGLDIDRQISLHAYWQSILSADR